MKLSWLVYEMDDSSMNKTDVEQEKKGGCSFAPGVIVCRGHRISTLAHIKWVEEQERQRAAAVVDVLTNSNTSTKK